MIRRCPNCGIELDKPPFNNRSRNEVMITLIYREKRDNGIKIKDILELGYCEICNATVEDVSEQKQLAEV